jgi:adenine-specific DNA-methyltransferase
MKTQPVPRETPDLRAERLADLRQLFPEAFSEGKLNFDQLRLILGDDYERPNQERYSFSWAGKTDAVRLAQMPTRATLLPCPEESVNWDTTQNVFIEGENLEVLKLLYQSYFGKVKLIYIDPPYNTGNDFIYTDDYSDPLAKYLEASGQSDDQGNILTSNPEVGGRFHSSWLSMIYPRIFLAKQLLRDDGVIFISIDDHEVVNLRMVLNEVFGEENFLGTFVRRRRMATGMRGDPVSPDHEYLVAYCKEKPNVVLYGRSRNVKDYPFSDEKGKFRSTDLTVGMTKEMRPGQYYPIACPTTAKEYFPPPNRVWRFQKSTMQEQVDAGNIIWPEDYPDKNLVRPRYRTRLSNKDVLNGNVPVSTWIDFRPNDKLGNQAEDEYNLVAGLNQDGTKELRDLFGEQLLEYPKPTSLLRTIVSLSTRDTDLVLDFFSGSCTTAQAVLEENRADGSTRHFIMVQIPEKTGKPDYRTIADIGKERIRRVGHKLEAGRLGQFELSPIEDLGFRVFKLSPSCYRQWPRKITDDFIPAQIDAFIDPLVEGWKTQNLLFELALKHGFSLTSSIEIVYAEDNTVYRLVDADLGQSFLVCLEDLISPVLLSNLDLKKDDLFIFRDIALDDSMAANLALQCRLETI